MAATSAVREVTHGRNLLPSINHHAPSTTSSCQASGSKAQWPFGLARMVQQDTRIALVSKTATACEVNQDGAGEREQQKCDINVPASLQRPADHSGPALAAPCLAVGQRAGYARDEHEYFRGIAEAVVPQRQPTSDIVGNMVKKDEPQRDAPAGVYSQVAAL